MALKGAQVVGLLLLWMSLGFFFDAATAAYQQDIMEEVSPENPPPERTIARQAVLGALGAVLLVTGLTLLTRDPGQGLTPGVPLGEEGVADDGPRRCYRCRKPWPPGAGACPHCGAERLQQPD